MKFDEHLQSKKRKGREKPGQVLVPKAPSPSADRLWVPQPGVLPAGPSKHGVLPEASCP